MSRPELDAAPGIPRDAEGPVFREPWEAQAFAMAVELNQRGVFTWTEWAAALAAEIKAAQAAGDPDSGETYYRHWLAALEKLVGAEGAGRPRRARNPPRAMGPCRAGYTARPADPARERSASIVRAQRVEGAMTLATIPIAMPVQVDRAILTATVALGGGAFIALVVLALALEDSRRLFASLVFGACLLLCSGCSYLYNMLETRWRPVLRLLDHGAIFLLIAGTYTPFAVRGVDGPFGLGLLEWVWGLALVGIALKVLLRHRDSRLFVPLYLALGWMFLSALQSFIALNSLSSLILLLIGGVAYTVGAAIYSRDIGPWTDAVWHGCVFVGSLSHLLAVIALRLTPPSI